jgi:hypothetical protein
MMVHPRSSGGGDTTAAPPPPAPSPRGFREPDCSAWLWLLIDKEHRATSRKLTGAIAETVVLRGVAPRAWFRTNAGDGAVVKVDAAHTTLERLKAKFTQMRINVRAVYGDAPSERTTTFGFAKAPSAVFGNQSVPATIARSVSLSQTQVNPSPLSSSRPQRNTRHTPGEDEPGGLRGHRALRRQPRAAAAPRRGAAHLLAAAHQRG